MQKTSVLSLIPREVLGLLGSTFMDVKSGLGRLMEMCINADG